MYNIDSLISILQSQAPTNKSIDEIRDVLNRVSTGVSIPNSKRNDLFNVVMSLKRKSRWGIREEATKVIERIKRDRLAEARLFYVENNQDASVVDSSIDPNHEVEASLITTGMVLYQWCKFVEADDGELTLYDGKKDICTVGRYFSTSQVPPESLGIFRTFEVRNSNGRFEGIGQQVCCRFTFTFSTPCLVSTAKRTFDTWNVRHDNKGRALYEDETVAGIKINKGYKGIWATGGAMQVFIPLRDDQKKTLALNAQILD